MNTYITIKLIFKIIKIDSQSKIKIVMIEIKKLVSNNKI